MHRGPRATGWVSKAVCDHSPLPLLHPNYRLTDGIRRGKEKSSPTGGISQSVKEEFPHRFEGTDLQTKITGRFKNPRLAALVQEVQLFRCGTQYPFQLQDRWKAFKDCTPKAFLLFRVEDQSRHSGQAVLRQEREIDLVLLLMLLLGVFF